MNGAGGPVEASWDEVVVLVGVRRWDGRPSAIERLAPGLSEHVAVLVVTPDPMPTATDREGRVRIVGPRLARVVAPGLTGGRWSSAARFDAALVRRTVRRTLAELGSPRVRALVVSTSMPRMGSVGEELRVFLVADDLLDGWAVPMHRVPKLERSLHRALEDADIVVAGSPVLAEVLGHAGVVAEIVPDGLDDVAPEPEDGSSSAAAETSPLADVAFVGDLAGDVDLDVLDAVAAAGHDLLLVGRGPRGSVTSALARVVRRTNVEWVGPRPVAEVPGLIARCRVGLVPLVDTPYTRARLPLDSLVHLAAGQPLVGNECEPIRWLLRAGGPTGARDGNEEPVRLDERDVASADDPAAIADLVADRLAAPVDPAAAERRRRFAASHHRSVRSEQFASILGIREPGAVESAS